LIAARWLWLKKRIGESVRICECKEGSERHDKWFGTIIQDWDWWKGNVVVEMDLVNEWLIGENGGEVRNGINEWWSKWQESCLLFWTSVSYLQSKNYADWIGSIYSSYIYMHV
jgi:hypothetical protein